MSVRDRIKQDVSLGRTTRPKRRPEPTHRRIVGLKIGASQLAAATVTNNGGPTLVQLAREPLAPGVVVAGELREPLALTDALKDFFRKHKLPTSGVRLGIGNNRIGVRTFDLPKVEEKQLENAILFRAQEALPIPVEEAMLDYHILDERFGEPQPRVLLVVTYRELVEGFAGACRAAGITLAGIDLEAFGLLRAVSALPTADQPARSAAMVAVSIGHQRSTVAVSSGRVCELTRVIDWGGANLDAAISRALRVPATEAASIKHTLSLSAGDDEDGERGDRRRARDAAVRELNSFARQLVSSLHFYQNQPGALEIGEIVVTGGTSHLEGLPEELERLMGAPVRLADPLTRVRPGKKLDVNGHTGSLAVAIGLGIED